MTRWKPYKKWLKLYNAGPQWPTRATLVAVQWQDATFHTELEGAELAQAVTVGIVVEATAVHLKTAAEFFHDGDVRDVTTIPAGMVQNIHPLGHMETPR